MCLTILATYLIFVKGTPDIIYISLDLLGFILNFVLFYFGYNGIRKENAKYLKIYLVLIIILFTMTLAFLTMLYV